MPQTIFDQLNPNPAKLRGRSDAKLTSRKENQTVDYIVVILAIAMVALYALLIHWLLPKT